MQFVYVFTYMILIYVNPSSYKRKTIKIFRSFIHFTMKLVLCLSEIYISLLLSSLTGS